MNIGIVIIVLASLSIAAIAFFTFGRGSSDGFAAEDDAAAADAAESPSETAPEDMKDREFAEHLLRANVYTRIYGAFDSATGRKPTLDEVDTVVRAYRKGGATLDSLEDYIRSNRELIDKGGDRAGDRANDGDDEGNDEGGDGAGDGGDGGGEGDEGGDGTGGGDEGDGAGGGGGGGGDNIIETNVRRLLKLAGVVASDERVKVVVDRARQGLSSLTDLIREESSRISRGTS
eukprot:jgi/Tetstr1/453928/TSEL_040847.t1